jgi:octaprenyl-diphosphate synthase
MTDFVHVHGGLEYASARAATFGRDAKDALRAVAPSPERDALEAAVDFIISRVN